MDNSTDNQKQKKLPGRRAAGEGEKHVVPVRLSSNFFVQDLVQIIAYNLNSPFFI